MRVRIGQFSGPAQHTVMVTHTGTQGQTSSSISWRLRSPPRTCRSSPPTRPRRWQPTGTRCTRRPSRRKERPGSSIRWLQRPSQSLCRRHVVLRTRLPWQPVRLGHHRVYGRSPLRRLYRQSLPILMRGAAGRSRPRRTILHNESADGKRFLCNLRSSGQTGLLGRFQVGHPNEKKK